jgi:hypothetical protein
MMLVTLAYSVPIAFLKAEFNLVKKKQEVSHDGKIQHLVWICSVLLAVFAIGL